MDTITLDSLHENLTFTGDLMIDSTFVLLPQTAPVTKELIQALHEWEFDSFYSEGNLSLGGDIGISLNSGEENVKSDGSQKMGDSLKKAIERSKNIQLDNSDNARMEMVQKVYDEYMNYIESVFTHYATHKQIDQEDLSETVQELCVFIKENKRFILRVNPAEENTDKNFLVTHSMRTTVLALAIAQQLRMPLSKMVDLGVTSIVHEIGMLRLPPQIYMTDKKLTPGERSQILKHPVLGYTITKDLNFPLTIQLGVLEHHEKENGTGYPQKKTGDKISTNAKIISVACSYEAISSSRSYKTGRSTFEAIVELLQNRERSYDDSIIRALLYTVSLFPIGSYVYLSDRKIAQVIDTNPDNPKAPIVQYLTEKEVNGSPKIIPTGTNGINIMRILSKDEEKDILKLVEDKYKVIEQAQSEAAAAPQNSGPVGAAKPSVAVNPAVMAQTEEVDINEFA
ncbi:MAG: HD domain-containing protein [Treponema sp.]|nr:HD domain-containing protein [Treponema sp.]